MELAETFHLINHIKFKLKLLAINLTCDLNKL